MTAAQRKCVQRNSTVGGGTPNKATLTLATEPDHSDDEFWKEAASIAGELERAHQNVRGTTAKVKRKRQQQQSGNSNKAATAPKQQKTDKPKRKRKPNAAKVITAPKQQPKTDKPKQQEQQKQDNQNQQEQPTVQKQLALMPIQTRSQTITLAGKSITIADDAQAQFLLEAAEEYKKRKKVEANKMRAQRIQTLKKELSRLRVNGAGLHPQLKDSS